MDKLHAIKIKQEDGTYSDEIPISVTVQNVDYNNSYTLKDILGIVNTSNPIQNQINALDDAIKAGQIIAENSGGIVVIEDGALNVPVRRMDVEFEYYQDQHGQSAPYPAGGGKNLLPYFSNGVTTNGVTFTTDEYGVVTANGTATGDAIFTLVVSNFSGNFYFNGAYDGSGSTYNMFVWDVTENTRCKKWDGSTASGNGYDTFEEVQIVQGHSIRFSLRVMNGYTADNVKFYPMLCRDTESDESYAPYSNICPITGVDTVNVHQSGRNLFDEANAVIYPRFFTTAKTWVVAADSTSVAFPCIGGVEYTVSAYNSELTIFRVGTIDHLPVDNSDTPAISNVTRMTSSGSVTITPDNGAKYIIIQCSKRIMDEGTANIQIELGSTPSDYEPYYGRTISVPLGQTVYGGNCTVTSGALDVTSGYVDLGTLTWTYDAGYGDFSATVPGMWTEYNWADSVSNLATTVYGYNNYAERGADMPDYTFSALQDTIVVKDPRYTDATAFTAAVSGVFFTYMLDAPVRTQLPPQVVRTYRGYNAFWLNGWSNGINIFIDYVADTGKAIETAVETGVNSVRDFVVHATEDDEGGYDVEESINDVTAAYNSGKSILCRVTSSSGNRVDVLPLSYVSRYFSDESGDYEYEYWFSGIVGNGPDGYRYRENRFYRLNAIYGVKATAIAPFWSDSKRYTVGDFVMADPYGNNTFDLYKCITDTSGDFDSDAWETTTVYDMVRDMINQ